MFRGIKLSRSVERQRVLAKEQSLQEESRQCVVVALLLFHVVPKIEHMMWTRQERTLSYRLSIKLLSDYAFLVLYQTKQDTVTPTTAGN